MNKKQLIARVQRYMGLGATHSAASAAVEAVLASILALSAQERLQMTRFGAFEWKKSARRSYYNLSQKGAASASPSLRLTFQAAKGFPERPL